MKQNKNLNYDFLSNLVLGEDKYSDLSQIAYMKNAIVLYIILIFFTILYFYQLFIKQNFEFLLFNAGILLVITSVMYILIKRNSDNSFKKMFVTAEGNPLEYICSFSDVITVSLNTGDSADYEYSSIKAIKKTANIYYLELQNNLTILLDKNMACNLKNTNFETYILEKCTSLKNKSILDISKGSNVYLSAIKFQALLFAAAIILYFAPTA